MPSGRSGSAAASFAPCCAAHAWQRSRSGIARGPTIGAIHISTCSEGSRFSSRIVIDRESSVGTIWRSSSPAYALGQ
jgi:hypothetical protein